MKGQVQAKNEDREKRHRQDREDDIDGMMQNSKTQKLYQAQLKIIQQEEIDYSQNRLKLACDAP